MSARELTRVEVLARVKAGALSVKSAAVLLQVGYRQAKRLVRRYRALERETEASVARKFRAMLRALPANEDNPGR